MEEIEVRKRLKRRSFQNGMLVGMLSMILLGAVVVGGLWLMTGIRPGSQAVVTQAGTDFSEEFSAKVSEIRKYIDEDYIFDIEEQKLLDGALAGYVQGLGDVYSVYMTPEEYADTMEDSDGNYVGIGVYVQQNAATGVITALTVYAGSPAEAGGMKNGDVLVAVDGTDVGGMTLNDVVDMIRGQEGTQVKVTVLRDGQNLELTMTRKSLEKVTVEQKMLDDRTGYIKLTEFDNVSVDQMKTALASLRQSGMEKLILDLRDNPGGLLNSVVSIADMFLPETNIFYSKDKQGNQTNYDSTAEQFCTEPLTVLINGNSASASEVLSGALKDNGRAVLVGEQSFGKGIVQSFYNLSDGSGLKLTSAHYFTPKGTDIHGVGITPDVVVTDNKDTEADEQLEAALAESKKEKRGPIVPLFSFSAQRRRNHHKAVFCGYLHSGERSEITEAGEHGRKQKRCPGKDQSARGKGA